MKYKCTGCGEVFESSVPESFCRHCGCRLEEEPEKQASEFPEMNFGRANAISGGVNLSSNKDSHNTYSTDSHNVTNNYVNQYEAQKTESEIFADKKKAFISYYKEICQDGFISQGIHAKLMSKAWSLDLDQDAAQKLILEEQQLRKALFQNFEKELSESDLEILSVIENAVDENDMLTAKELFPDLEVINTRNSNEKVQYFYYCLYAALYPDKMIGSVGPEISFPFWKVFWLSQAYRRKGMKNESVRALSRISGQESTSSVKGILLECIKDLGKSNIALFRNHARDKYNRLMAMDPGYLISLVCSIGHFLGEIEKVPGCDFYLEYFAGTEEPAQKTAKFVLPEMYKINQL